MANNLRQQVVNTTNSLLQAGGKPCPTVQYPVRPSTNLPVNSSSVRYNVMHTYNVCPTLYWVHHQTPPTIWHLIQLALGVGAYPTTMPTTGLHLPCLWDVKSRKRSTSLRKVISAKRSLLDTYIRLSCKKRHGSDAGFSGVLDDCRFG